MSTYKTDPALSGLRTRVSSKRAVCSMCNSRFADYEHRVERDGFLPRLEPLCRECRVKLYYNLRRDNLPDGLCTVSTASALLEDVLGKSHRTIYPRIHDMIRAGKIPCRKLHGPHGRFTRYVELKQVYKALNEVCGW